MDKFLYTGGNQPDKLTYPMTAQEYELLRYGARRLLANTLEARAAGTIPKQSPDHVRASIKEVVETAKDTRSYGSEEDYVVERAVDERPDRAEETFIGDCIDAAEAGIHKKLADAELARAGGDTAELEEQLGLLATMREVEGISPKVIRRELSATAD